MENKEKGKLKVYFAKTNFYLGEYVKGNIEIIIFFIFYNQKD